MEATVRPFILTKINQTHDHKFTMPRFYNSQINLALLQLKQEGDCTYRARNSGKETALYFSSALRLQPLEKICLNVANVFDAFGRCIMTPIYQYLRGSFKSRVADLMDSNSNQGVDMISGLPDHVICHILSFLPTKYAVASSILSTRWRYLWTSVPTLDFDARLHGGFCPNININVNRGSDVAFQNFVSRVLLLNDIPHIRKFRLIYECHYVVAPIRTWLHVGITRKIEELELDFFLSRSEFLHLPKKFFTSSSLRVLKLSRMPLDVPSYVSFPWLKILELKRIAYLNDECIQNLLCGCQVLEDLVIEETTREKPRVVHLSMHTLKRFSFGYRFAMDRTVDCPYKFFINAPKLEYFHVKGRISDDLVVKNLANLINAHVDLRQTGVAAENYSICCQRACSLLKGMSNVKFLALSNDIVQLLCAGHDRSLPRFLNLTNLAFGICLDFCWKKLVTEFIECSPDLEVLTLNNKQGFLRDIDEVQKTPAQPMPEYLLSYLKDILIEALYANFSPEGVEFLPQEVNILKRLKINCQCPLMLRYQIGYTF